MEAAAARYAARDRFGEFGQPGQTQLQRMIQNAVDPQNFEPNLALDLEIADLINTKRGGAPREAAVAIVSYINSRNPNVSLLALTLLDICVKNCGYPFHLQISTKEFLNELVRRFPEHPPIRPTRVQLRVLEAIEEWRTTICQTSRYKEDLGFIRDMHRLLTFKGYLFPEVRREDAAVLNANDSLKSAEEMEEEERTAQSAKLQELIRRGSPRDLQEANQLMKVMAGYDNRNKTDYRAKAAEEVGKIQQKARLLEERLQNFKPGDQMSEGDVFEELASALQSAHPKIRRMCEEESEDQEAVAKLFEINDSIHRTIERYKLMKKGDIEAAHKIPQGTLGTTTGVRKNAQDELSLIDFDREADTSAQPAANTNAAPTDSLENDLLGLSFQESSQSYGQGGGIALGFGANTNIPGPSLLSSMTDQSTAKSTAADGSSTTAGSSSMSAGPPKPNYDAFSAFTSQRNSQSSTPIPTSTAAPAAPPSQPQAAPQIDPFQSLMKANHATTAPSSSYPTSTVPNPLFDPNTAAKNASLLEVKATNGANSVDDDWNFSSSLPEEALPSQSKITVAEGDIRITFAVSRDPAANDVVTILVSFSNTTPQLVTEYTFQVAVTKAYQLKLTPQSGRKLQPLQADGITQPIEVHGVPKGQADKVKIRWKASYKIGGNPSSCSGEVPPLGIA